MKLAKFSRSLNLFGNATEVNGIINFHMVIKSLEITFRYYRGVSTLTHYLPVVSYDTEQTLKTLPTNGNVHANFLHFSGNLAAEF